MKERKSLERPERLIDLLHFPIWCEFPLASTTPLSFGLLMLIPLTRKLIHIKDPDYEMVLICNLLSGKSPSVLPHNL